VYTRAVGFFGSLFLLLIISGPMKTLEGFHKNILVALWASPVILSLFLWILWRYSRLQRVNRAYLAGEADEAQWELRMSIAFCSLLATIVIAAFFLARSGMYPK
jgi:purine-cytosine permease-like protein